MSELENFPNIGFPDSDITTKFIILLKGAEKSKKEIIIQSIEMLRQILFALQENMESKENCNNELKKFVKNLEDVYKKHGIIFHY